MKLSDIPTDDMSIEEDVNLKITDFENFFDVYQDKRGEYMYNLNENLYINVKKADLKTIKLEHDMFWTTISYIIYGTTRLAWVLIKLNDVKDTEIFDIRKAGDDIYYLEKDYVQNIINTIN